MKNITLQLDDETLARLDACGESHTAGGQGNEILGMALLEAYQHNKRKARVAARLDDFTFAGLVAFAKTRGVTVERKGRVIEFWRTSDTVGECATLAEVWAEIESGAI